MHEPSLQASTAARAAPSFCIEDPPAHCLRLGLNESALGQSEASLRFRLMRTLQKFGSVHDTFNHFNQDRHLVSRDDFKSRQSAAFAEWKTLAG